MPQSHTLQEDALRSGWSSVADARVAQNMDPMSDARGRTAGSSLVVNNGSVPRDRTPSSNESKARCLSSSLSSHTSRAHSCRIWQPLLRNYTVGALLRGPTPLPLAHTPSNLGCVLVQLSSLCPCPTYSDFGRAQLLKRTEDLKTLQFAFGSSISSVRQGLDLSSLSCISQPSSIGYNIQAPNHKFKMINVIYAFYKAPEG